MDRAVGFGMVAFLLATGCAPGPEAVAERYLRHGAREEREQVLALVDPACHDARPIVNVAPTHVLGARIEIAELHVALLQKEGDRAQVSYSLTGSIPGKERSLKIGKVEVKGDMGIDEITQTGTLDLVRSGGRWLVTCR